MIIDMLLLKGYSVLKSSEVKHSGTTLYRYFLAICSGNDVPYRVVRESWDTASYVSTCAVLMDTDDLSKANIVFERGL